MKQYLFIFLLIFELNQLYSQSENKEYFKSNNICEVKTLIYFNNDNKPEVTRIDNYDSNGNKIKSLSFDTKNKLSKKFEYKYDEHNNKIATIEKGKKLNETNYVRKYDGQKNLIEESGINFITKFEYDSVNRVIKKYHTNLESMESKEILFKYDNNGNKIAEYVQGSPFYLNEFSKYNSDNQIIETEVYYHLENEDKLYEKRIYNYDENKLLKSKKSIEGYAKSKDLEYSYYDNNKLKSIKVVDDSLTTYFYEGELITRIEKITYLFNTRIVEQFEYNYCK